MHLMRLLFVTVLVMFAALAQAGDTVIKLRDLYNKDLSFSDYAQQHQGKKVTVIGFMAPPLKTESPFFVLTKRPMSVCPFCETDADWPTDIVAVYGRKTLDAVAYNVPIAVSGVLELGSYTDPEFQFVSRVRLTSASYRKD